MSISNNPFLGPQWEPLAQLITLMLDDMRVDNSREFVVQTYGHNFGLSPNTSPFLQAKCNQVGEIQMELSSNLMIEPPLTPDQYRELEFYGWTPPEVTPEEFRSEGGNPNFVRYYPATTKTEDITEFILMSLVAVCGIEERDFFAFGSKERCDRVDSFKKLDRLPADCIRNPDAVIFAMPGQHTDMLKPKGSVDA